MDDKALHAGVLEIAAMVSSSDRKTMTLDLRIAEDLGMKSMARIELAALLEEKFGVTISNFEIRKPKTLQEITELLKKKQAESE